MSAETKVFQDKMNHSIEHLSKELSSVRAGRANPAVLDKVTVDYYGAPTPSTRWRLWLWRKRVC